MTLSLENSLWIKIEQVEKKDNHSAFEKALTN